MRLPKWLRSPLTIVALAVILVTVSGLEFSQWRKRDQIQQEIDHVIAQQKEYQQKNQDLQDSLNLLNTAEYKDKIAREQLNLRKEGEIVVNFPPPAPGASQTEAAGQTNPQK